MPRIFLSHSSKNNAAALALATWLQSRGWNDYFLDISEHRGIAPGERWMAALAGAVDRCEAVIFLVSPAWRDSKYCFAEFYQAKNLGKRIFGVIVEPIALSQLPEQLTAEWQVCDLTHAEDPVAFSVGRVPLVPQTTVHFPAAGLEALARGLHKAGLDPSYFEWPPGTDPKRSPYPGLRALDDLDAAVFFGREATIVRAIDQIRQIRDRDTERLFVILGASGAGKSSFLRAGLLPRLRRDSEHFVVLPPIRPERAAISGSHGLIAALASGLARAGQQGSNLAELRRTLADIGLSGLLRRIATRPFAENTQPIAASRTVIVPVDQAEELFAADAGAEAHQLLQLIEALRQDLLAAPVPAGERLRVLFVITIRSDSLPRMQADATLQPLAPVLFSLPAMPASEFKAVIEGPARRHSETVRPLAIAPQLTDQLMADAKGADALPLLALTLEWLYREYTTDQGTRLEQDEYHRLGGIGGVINQAVARAFEQPGQAPAIPARSAEQEQLLEQVFPFLATVDPDTGDWKRRVAVRAALRASAPQAEAMVERLIEQRLLVKDVRQMPGSAEPVEVVEVAHEALLRQWDRLERWLRTFSEDLAAVESVRRAAQDWDRGSRDEVLLVHTAHRLQAAEALRAAELFKPRFEGLDEQYLTACRERDQHALIAREEQLRQMAEQQAKLSDQQAKRAALQRRAGWGLSLALVVLLGLTGLIVQQTRELGRQTSLVFASAAEAATDRHETDRGVRLAILANHASGLSPAHATAHAALATAADSNLLRVLLGGGKSAIVSVDFSPDGKRVLTASQDGSAQVWDAESGLPLSAPLRHEGDVTHAAFSPDGRRVVTASIDDTARLWDAQSGEALGAPMRHEGGVRYAAFSPDGRRVVTVSGDGTARLWDAQSGQALGAPLRHEVTVWHAAFSPDGRRVVTASADETARLWDAQSGQALGAPMRHEDTVWHVAFSPDGRRVVTASSDKTARLWDAQSGQALGAPMRHEYDVTHAAFSPDGRRVVTASDDRTARLWDAQSGEALGAPMRHEGTVFHAAFSPDGRRVVTASDDKTARLWDAQSGEALGAPLRHEDTVTHAAFSPDGRRVVTVSGDGTARLWDAQSGEALGAPPRHVGGVRYAAFSPDGRRVVTASDDKTARLWDAQSGQALGAPMRHEDVVYHAAFSPDGRRVVTASDDNTVRLWDAQSGQALGAPMRHEYDVTHAAFSPDGRRVVTASDDNTVRLWDAQSGQALGAPLRHEYTVTHAAFSPDGRRVVTASGDRTARLWDAQSGEALGAPMRHEDVVYHAAFSPDGRRVVTASGDRTARLWDAQSGQALGAPMDHEGTVFHAAFSPDGRRVVTASRDGTARLWDAQSGETLGAPLRHESWVYHAAFSPDGRRVVTASWDNTARLWDVQSGQALGAPLRHEDTVYHAAFSPDGRRVVTASRDNTARLWSTDWSMFTSTEALVAAACAQMNPAARQITVHDRRLVPLIPPEWLGEDVCGQRVADWFR